VAVALLFATHANATTIQVDKTRIKTLSGREFVNVTLRNTSSKAQQYIVTVNGLNPRKTVPLPSQSKTRFPYPIQAKKTNTLEIHTLCAKEDKEGLAFEICQEIQVYWAAKK